MLSLEDVKIIVDEIFHSDKYISIFMFHEDAKSWRSIVMFESYSLDKITILCR